MRSNTTEKEEQHGHEDHAAKDVEKMEGYEKEITFSRGEE